MRTEVEVEGLEEEGIYNLVQFRKNFCHRLHKRQRRPFGHLHNTVCGIHGYPSLIYIM